MSMAKWNLCFVLILPLFLNTKVKTIGSKAVVTEICSNSTQNIITLIVCKISTERSREECRLLYQHGQEFVHGCDSRFTLVMENQTVFLHLTGLTPVDRGNYTCECSLPDGTYILHVNITVEEDEDASSSGQMLVSSALAGLTISIFITGVVLGLIHRRICHGRRPEPLSSRPNSEPQDIEPYSTFTQKENGLYSALTVHVSSTNTDNSNFFT